MDNCLVLLFEMENVVLFIIGKIRCQI